MNYEGQTTGEDHQVCFSLSSKSQLVEDWACKIHLYDFKCCPAKGTVTGHWSGGVVVEGGAVNCLQLQHVDLTDLRLPCTFRGGFSLTDVATQLHHRYPKPYIKLNFIELRIQTFYCISKKIYSQVFRKIET